MHAVEAMYCIPKVLTASVNLFLNMSDTRETVICSFTGITHISEKVSICKYSIHHPLSADTSFKFLAIILFQIQHLHNFIPLFVKGP